MKPRTNQPLALLLLLALACGGETSSNENATEPTNTTNEGTAGPAEGAGDETTSPQVKIEGLPALDTGEMSVLVREEFDRALKELQADPKDAARWLALGQLAHAHGRSEYALACYLKVQELAKNNPRALHLAAVLQRKVGQFEKAIEGFDRTVAISRENGGMGYAPAQVYAALTALELGRTDDALERLDAAVKEFGRYEVGRLERANLLLQLDRAEDARADLEWLVANATPDVRVASALARLESLAGNDAKSNEWATKAGSMEATIAGRDMLLNEVTVLAGGSVSRMRRIAALLEAGEYAKVVEESRALLEHSDEDQARVYLVRALQAEQKHAEALAILEPMIARLPEGAEVRLLAALSSNRTDRPAEALALAEAARAIKATPTALSYMGESYVLLQRYTEAHATYEALYGAEQKLSVTDWMMWGTAQVQVGLVEGGIQCFQAVTSADPNYANAHYNLGQAYQTIGRFEEAIASYQAATSLNPAIKTDLKIEQCRGGVRSR